MTDGKPVTNGKEPTTEDELLEAMADRLTNLSGKITPPLPAPAVSGYTRTNLIGEISKQLKALEEKVKELPGHDAPTVSEAARIAEYNSLSSFINSRNTQQMTLNSFLVTGAVLALTFAVKNESGRIGGAVALFPALLIIIAWTNLFGIRNLDDVTYERIRAIEKQLDIRGLEGHTGIYEKVRNRPLYKARKNVRHFFYVILLAASVITAVHLFWPAFWLEALSKLLSFVPRNAGCEKNFGAPC